MDRLRDNPERNSRDGAGHAVVDATMAPGSDFETGDGLPLPPRVAGVPGGRGPHLQPEAPTGLPASAAVPRPGGRGPAQPSPLFRV